MRAAPQPSAKRLSLSILGPFASPALAIGSLNVIVFVYLPPYFAGHLAVSMTLIGQMWMLVRLVDIPVDPLLAMVMDRTRTPIGRYRAWMLAGAPILMLALYKLFMAPRGFGAAYLFGWLVVLYLGNSIVYLGHSAWAATLATRYHERSRLFGLMTAVGVLGTIGVLSISIAHAAFGLSGSEAVQAMGWAMIVMLPFGVLLAAVRAPERLAPETEGPKLSLGDLRALVSKPDLIRLFVAQMALTLGPGWMSAIYIFYFTFGRGFSVADASLLLAVYILAQIPGALLAARVSRAIGKHRMLMLATTSFSVGLLALLVIPRANLPLTIPGMVWCGMSAAGFDLMIRAMLADVGDEVRLEQGKQRTSLLYATNTLAQKLAAAFTIGLTFPLLASLGFNPADGARNSAAAIGNLQIAFMSGPIVFVMLGGACLIGWRLDADRHAQIREALDARDAMLEGAPSAV